MFYVSIFGPILLPLVLPTTGMQLLLRTSLILNWVLRLNEVSYSCSRISGLDRDEEEESAVYCLLNSELRRTQYWLACPLHFVSGIFLLPLFKVCAVNKKLLHIFVLFLKCLFEI